MKTRTVVITVVAALAAAAAAAVPVVEEHAAARIKAEIERDGVTTVSEVDVGLFERSITFTGLTSRQAGDLTIGRWHAAGLSWPLGELLRGHTPLSGWRLGDPLSAERIELQGMRLVDGNGGTWTIGSLSLEGLELGRYDADVGLGRSRLATLGARILHALALRRLEERDLTYAVPFSGDTIRIGGFVLERFDKGGIDSFVLTGFEALPRGAAEPAFRVGDLSGKGIDFSRPLAALSSPAWRPGSAIGRIQVGSLVASGFAGAVLGRYGISLERITHQTERKGPDLVRAQTRVAGFVLAPPLRGLEALRMRAVMQSMGLKEVRLDFDCSGIEDRARQELAVDRCALTGRDLAEIDLTFEVVNADEAFWRGLDTGEGGAFYASKAGFGAIKLVAADKSLLDRMLRAMAVASGQPVAVTRSNLAQEIRRFQPAGVLITEDMTKLLETVARFVEQGGTLTIEARPDPPFGMDRIGYLMSPGPDLVDMLGLSATLSR